MYEVVMTSVSLETTDDEVTYPVTEVFRIEFDTDAAMQAWMATAHTAPGVVNMEMLGAR